MNANGDIAEIAFIHECYKRGFKAFIPYSHDTKTDVIIKRPGEQPISVQIKKGTLQKNAPHLTQSWKALVGSAKSSNIRRTKSPRFTPYAPNAFDVLAIYIQEQDRWVMHKLADIVGRASIRWNAKHPSNNWEVIENYHHQIMNTPNIGNKVIFHDWKPRELQALIRATAVLHSKQPRKDDNTIKPPVLRSKHIQRRSKP